MKKVISLILLLVLHDYSSTVVVTSFTTTTTTCTTGTARNSYYRSNHKNNIIYYLSSSSSSSSSEEEEKETTTTTFPETNGKTLYEIMRLNPTASRSEVKKKYHNLARVYHPDASSGTGDDDAFTELVNAYKILHDPRLRKKYDRDLRAKEIANNIESAAEGIFDSIFKPMFGNRKTAASSSAASNTFRNQAAIKNNGSVVSNNTVSNNVAFSNRTSKPKSSTRAKFKSNAKAKGTKKGNEGGNGVINLASATLSAIMASMDAGKVVESLELADKAEELEAMYREESEAAQKVREKLAAVTSERLRQSIYVSESELTAAEAEEILEVFNIPDTMKMVDAFRLKNSCQQEINCLYEREKESSEVRGNVRSTMFVRNEDNLTVKRNELKLTEALLVEEQAREALLAATKTVKELELKLVESTKSASLSEKTERQMKEKSNKVELAKSRQIERVRSSLREKAEKVANEMNIEVIDLFSKVVGSKNSSLQVEELPFKDLKKLENDLVSEAVVLEARASRHLSRALKLRANAKDKLGDTMKDNRIQNDSFFDPTDNDESLSSKPESENQVAKRPTQGNFSMTEQQRNNINLSIVKDQQDDDTSSSSVMGQQDDSTRSSIVMEQQDSDTSRSRVVERQCDDTLSSIGMEWQRNDTSSSVVVDHQDDAISSPLMIEQQDSDTRSSIVMEQQRDDTSSSIGVQQQDDGRRSSRVMEQQSSGTSRSIVMGQQNDDTRSSTGLEQQCNDTSSSLVVEQPDNNARSPLVIEQQGSNTSPPPPDENNENKVLEQQGNDTCESDSDQLQRVSKPSDKVGFGNSFRYDWRHGSAYNRTSDHFRD